MFAIKKCNKLHIELHFKKGNSDFKNLKHGIINCNARIFEKGKTALQTHISITKHNRKGEKLWQT